MLKHIRLHVSDETPRSRRDNASTSRVGQRSVTSGAFVFIPGARAWLLASCLTAAYRSAGGAGREGRTSPLSRRLSAGVRNAGEAWWGRLSFLGERAGRLYSFINLLLYEEIFCRFRCRRLDQRGRRTGRGVKTDLAEGRQPGSRGFSFWNQAARAARAAARAAPQRRGWYRAEVQD